MAQNSYFMVSLGMLNLLLVAAGLLLTYFDWSAARRREFLYLYFAEDKPGVNYFAAARRRRAQYTRLLTAFFLLVVGEFLIANLFIGVQDTEPVQRWVQVLRMLGLAMLGLGFLYGSETGKRFNLDNWIGGFICLWAVFALLVAAGVFKSGQTIMIVSSVVRLLIAAFFTGMAWRQRRQEVAQGLLQSSGDVLSMAFLLWAIEPLGNLLGQPDEALVLGQVVAALSYCVLVMMVARGVLAEYETVESSRHRLGRERQVIFSFLQRIGAAFTTAVEVDQVLRIVLESALETTEASAGAIYLYHADTGLLEPRVVLNFFPPLHVDTPAALSPHRTEELEEEMKHQAFHLGEGVIGEVAQAGRARIIEDVRAENVMLGTTTDFMRNRSMLMVPLKIRDEPLGVMAVLNKQRGSFGQEDQFLLQALADQGALSINNAMLTLEVGKQERLRRELQIARDIQRMLLPEKCPIVPGFELAARGSSAYEVGGDYYDFFWVDDDRLGIVVADVSGKGVPAALTVAMMRSVFRTQARGNLDVRDVLSQVNQFMSQDLRRSDFITCVYGILEISTRRFSWGRAGHEPMIVAHESAPTDVLRPEGFALGVIDSPQFDQLLEVETVQLRSGDRLLIFTDGLTEAMNAEGEEFGMERILDVMNHVKSSSGKNGTNGANGHQHSGAGDENTANAPVSAAPVSSAANTGNDKAGGSELEDGKGPLEMTRNAPCSPESSVEDPDDLKSMEIAVHDHVGNEPQSDDLTIVYLSTK